ncbi:putative ribosomal protein L24e/L24 superfamily [Helianthus anomalus]
MFNITFTLVVVIGLSYADSVARRFTMVRVLDSSESDSQVYNGESIWDISILVQFLNVYFHNKLKPSKLTWTAMYRKQHRRRGVVQPRSHSRLLWELLWKLFRRREVRNLKSVMLLERLLFGMAVVLCFSCS